MSYANLRPRRRRCRSRRTHGAAALGKAAAAIMAALSVASEGEGSDTGYGRWAARAAGANRRCADNRRKRSSRGAWICAAEAAARVSSSLIDGVLE